MVPGFFFFFCIIVLFICDFTVNMNPKHRAEVLSGVPKHTKAVMCLTEKMRVLEKLHSDIKSGTVGCESTTYIK